MIHPIHMYFISTKQRANYNLSYDTLHKKIGTLLCLLHFSQNASQLIDFIIRYLKKTTTYSAMHDLET